MSRVLKIDRTVGQFELTSPQTTTYMGTTCQIEVLKITHNSVNHSAGGRTPVIDCDIKVHGVDAVFGRTLSWYKRHPNFGLGTFDLSLKKMFSTKFKWWEPIPIKVEESAKFEITPCPDCNGSCEYVGLFERKACPTCC